MRIVKPITIADSNLVSSNVLENDQPVYSSTAGYNLKDKVMVLSNHTIYEVQKQETSTVTISQGSPTVITWQAHGLSNGRMVKFSTAGTLPTGINATTTYYVINSSTNTFNVSTTSGGAAVNTTTAGSGVHTCLAMVNNLDPVLNPTYWLNSGKTNRWKMFDTSVQSQTTNTTSVSAVVTTAGAPDTVALLNMTGNSAQVVVSGTVDGTVYNQTVSLVEDETAVEDWWDYFFTDFRIRTDYIFTDIPPYSNATISITVSNGAGSIAGIGAAVLGAARDISSAKMGVEQGARNGITDYSIKTRNAFGDYVITERAFSKRANWSVYVDNENIDSVFNMLAAARATPILYIGSKKYNHMAIYGFYKSFEVSIAYPDFSVVDIEIDGLT